MRNKRVILILSSALALLFIPFFGMFLTDQVNWKPNDFVIAGVLLIGTGLLCELILRKVRKGTYRLALVLLVLAVLLLVWVELAVGLFGTPFAGS